MFLRYKQHMQKIQEFFEKPEVPFIGLALSILCIVLAITILRFKPTSSQNEPVIQTSHKSTPLLMVDVEGAVQKPGVYEFGSSTRLVDVLTRAGGLIAQADRMYVAKNMNLSKHTTDEDKIYIPFLSERIDSTEDNISPVRVNTASTSQLQLLPGIGSVTASKIIENRPYENIEELVVKKTLGQKLFENIKNLITL